MSRRCAACAGWRAALAAVTAAVVGIIANLALWFALHVLFGAVGEVAVGPLTLPVPDVSTFDLAAAIIALAAGVALIRFKANLFAVLAAAMAAGIASGEGFEPSVEQARHRFLGRRARDRLADQVGDRDDADVVRRPRPLASAGSSR